MSSTSRACMVAASMRAVEALKNNGFAGWNHTSRSLHQHAKGNLALLSQTQRFACSTCLNKDADLNSKAKQSEESLRKVMYLSCWGPN